MEDDNYLKQKYFLENRTVKFAITIIQFVKSLKLTFYNSNILSQLLKSGTSIGANYREANGAESWKDFMHKISICKKEAKETEYWLTLLLQTDSDLSNQINKILAETNELIKIFAKIYTTLKIKIKN